MSDDLDAAIERDDGTAVAHFLKSFSAENVNYVLQRAVLDGRAKAVEQMLLDDRFDPAADENELLGYAVSSGHAEIVAMFLRDSRVDPAARDGYAIREACGLCLVEIVKMLLADKRVNPADADNEALYRATENSTVASVDAPAVIELLLRDPRVDPSARGSSVVRWAAKYGHNDLLERLLRDSRVDVAAAFQGCVAGGAFAARVRAARAAQRCNRSVRK
jgi:hypothetical protein